MASVKVAVRVRPFSQREIDNESECIIRMQDNSTTIVNLSANERDEHLKLKDFTFDHSYWSHDDTRTFTSQERVFEDLGKEVVDCAFEGFNACIFAYGQTGSGKTYTMMGTPEDPGLTPRICKALFNRMKENIKTYRVTVSYLEIYQERVTDLLNASHHSSVRVRENHKGTYVDGLTIATVTDYEQIERCMKRGNTRRTTAKTKMNDASSRSHAIFTIKFVQASLNDGVPNETTSKIHLVDLAGSERVASTEATGKQLKEGASINKSLVTLGQVIFKLSKLPPQKNGAKTKVHIPYRDSNLTWILKDSLGGNSKTIMLAAISPADINYQETMSTLRYADSAKSIINKPKINEDENVRVIRELREQIKMLKAQQPQRVHEIYEKEREEQKLTQEWTTKWKEAHAILQEKQDLALRKSGHGVVLDSDLPHLTVIEDCLLSTGVCLYQLKEGETSIGTDDEDVKQDIILRGSGVESYSCSIIYADGVATIYPKGNSTNIKINNVPITSPTKLTQGCRVLLAGTHLFKYNDPAEAAELRKNEGMLNLSRMSLLSSTSDLSGYMDSSQILLNDNEKNEIEIEKINLAKEKEDFQKRLKTFQEAQALFESERLKMEQEAKVQEMRLESDRIQIERQKKAQEQRLESERLKLEEEEINLQERKLELQLQKEKELEMLSKNLEVNNSESWKDLIQCVKTSMETDVENRDDLKKLLQKVTFSSPKQDDLKYLIDLLHQFTSRNNVPDIANHLELLSLMKSKYSDLQDEEILPIDDLKHILINRTTKELSELEQKKQSLRLPLCLSNGSPEKNTLSSDTYHTATSDCSANLQGTEFPENLMSDSGVGLGRHIPPYRNCDFSSDDDSKGVSDSQSTSSIENRPYLTKRRRKDHEALRSLSQKINQQKVLIMRGLDVGWSRQVLDEHISVLNELQRKHMSLKYGSPLILSPATEHPLQDLNSPSPSPIRPLHRGSTSTLDSTNFLLHNQRYSSLSNFQLHRSMPSIAMSSDCDSIVSITGYFLRGAGKRTHYEYEVRIATTFGEWWSVLRRYSRFRDLHLAMKAKYGEKVAQIPFPPRQLFANSESLAQSRKRQLETYLRRLIEVCKTHPSCCLAYSETISKSDLITFSPFFSKGVFENSKFGTS